jgi:hypothetical protein
MDRFTEMFPFRLGVAAAAVGAAAGLAAWLLTYQESKTVAGWGPPGSLGLAYVSPAWTVPVSVVVMLAGLATASAVLRRRRSPSPR